MRLREVMPWMGERSARQRLHDLEERAGTLPVLFALFFSEAVKIASLNLPVAERVISGPPWVAECIQMAALAAVVGVVYVYDVDTSDLDPRSE